jgi:hypothetical protein
MTISLIELADELPDPPALESAEGVAASAAVESGAAVASAAWVKAGQVATIASVAATTLPMLFFARNMKSLLKTFERKAIKARYDVRNELANSSHSGPVPHT